MPFKEYGEGITRKRTLQNTDEPIRTNMTPDGVNLLTTIA